MGLQAATLTAHLPVVAIVSPVAGQQFSAPASVPVNVSASQFDTLIADVTAPGSEIAYESVTGDVDHQIFHVNVADLLSGEIKTVAEVRSPSWSPKGYQIAYLDFKEQAYFSVSPAGANKKLLVKAGYALLNGPLLRMWLVWAPDQQNAIYNAYYDGGVEAIGVDLLTGKKHTIKRVGNFEAVDWWP